jgi:hypothetical protein
LPAAAGGPPLPKAPEPPRPPGGIPAASLARRIDEFLASRGYTAPASPPPPSGRPFDEAQGRPFDQAQGRPFDQADRTAQPVVKPEESAEGPGVEKPADFVCEDDVRQAVKQGRKIVIGERSIVTPAARDLGEQHHVFLQAEWPR